MEPKQRFLTLKDYKANRALASRDAPERLPVFGGSVADPQRGDDVRKMLALAKLETLLTSSSNTLSTSNSVNSAAVGDWLLVEGVDGLARQGLQRMLCYVKAWCRVLRAEGVAKEAQGTDSMEGKARNAFSTCMDVLSGVNEVIKRFYAPRKEEKRIPEQIIKTISEALPRFITAMAGQGDCPRMRSLHWMERNQLRSLVLFWRNCGVLRLHMSDSLGLVLGGLQPEQMPPLSSGKGASLSSGSGTVGPGQGDGGQGEGKKMVHSAWQQAVPPFPGGGFSSAGPGWWLMGADRGPGGGGGGWISEEERKLRLSGAIGELREYRPPPKIASNISGGAAFKEGLEGGWKLRVRWAGMSPPGGHRQICGAGHWDWDKAPRPPPKVWSRVRAGDGSATGGGQGRRRDREGHEWWRRPAPAPAGVTP
ncbi:unnamed protein product, partial [Discosporangium mesarthrocarpum]